MKKIFWIGFLTLAAFTACEEEDSKGDLEHITYGPTSLTLDLPNDFPALPPVPENPLTAEGVDLGRHLFYDKILSGDGTMSCASCHKQSAAFTDNLAVSTGIDGIAGSRSAMSLVNLAFANNGLMWDGRFDRLERQAIDPVENPIELHEDWGNVEERLQASPHYPEKFRAAFGIKNKTEITRDLAAKALAQFQRTLISGNSKFDKVWRGEAFFTESEQNGYDMFFETGSGLPDAECGHCHNTPLFLSNQYMNNGLEEAPNLTEFPDKGRGAITGIDFDNGRFKVPTLRNIELTAPYMHDGRFQTLEEVVEHYNSGGHYAPNRESLILELNLNEQQKADLVAFLKTLTDEDFVTNPAFSDPN